MAKGKVKSEDTELQHNIHSDSHSHPSSSSSPGKSDRKSYRNSNRNSNPYRNNLLPTPIPKLPTEGHQRGG